MTRIGIAAGEASGDLLAAGLIEGIRELKPDAIFEGVAGPRMIKAGCRALVHSERLSVMGLVEVLGRYNELRRDRASLRRHFLANPPDVFIGVDSPDFNLGLEKVLRRAGIPTVHYVSPSVWAWRRYRLRKIAAAADLVLTLFPFESEVYREHDIAVRFVGHPLADMLPLEPNAAAAREQLGLPGDAEVVALLPGSRVNEVKRLAEVFVQAAQWCRDRRPGVRFVAPLVNVSTRMLFEQALARFAPELPVTVIDGRAHEAMEAADVVLVASGTATLEALLLKRPMVVAYRLSPLTHALMKRMSHVEHYALANLLAGRSLVPELIQDAATPANLGRAVIDYLEHPDRVHRLKDVFTRIHRDLRRDASREAAAAVVGLLQSGG